MNPLTLLYTELIYRPLLNGLVFIYATLPYRDLGLAIGILTVVVQLLLHPFLVRTIRSQQAMARVAPRLREIQKQFKDNREEQARRTMALYREHGVHPFSVLVPTLIQLPILIGLYQVFWKGIALDNPALLYAFVPNLGEFNPTAFSFIDLTQKSVSLAVAVGITQFFRAKSLPQPPAPSSAETSDFSRVLNLQTTYFFPIMITVIAWFLPSAVVFYLIVSNLFAIVQQLWIQRHLSHEERSRTAV